MRTQMIGIGLGVIIVAVLWTTGYASAIVGTFIREDPFETAMTRVQRCTTSGDFASCVRPVAATMLSLKSAADIMDALAVRLPPQQCHYVGHVVGQQLYTKMQSVEAALAACDRTCDSACFHGVIGQAFAVALGHPDPDDLNFDLKHLSVDDIATIGKRLCTSAGACHGVGHVLFQAYEKFEPAFAMCRQIGGASIVTCYNGVTMEYADVLSARNMRAVPDTTLPDADTLDRLCIFPTPEEERACFRYFPRIVEETLEHQGIDKQTADERIRRMCESYTSVDRRVSCVAGIGSHDAYAVLTDTAAAVATCGTFPSTLDHAACVLGMVSVATGDRMRPLAAFCDAQTTDRMRASCYQDLFFTLQSGDAVYDVATLCGAHNPACQSASQNAKTDSWTMVGKEFAR